jgi:hypothetical protein
VSPGAAAATDTPLKNRQRHILIIFFIYILLSMNVQGMKRGMNL